MEQDLPFARLLLITLLAVVVPILVSRVRAVRLPAVVGEILAGIIIGQSGLDLVPPSQIIDFLAQFGFIFLMFLSGLEVDFSLLFGSSSEQDGRPRWIRPVPLAGAILSLTLILAVLVGAMLLFAGLIQNAVLMGLILSTTSLGIVVPVLKERRLTATPYGQAVLATALVSDFATLLLLSIAIAVFSRGISLDVLFFLLLLLAFPVAARVGRWAVSSDLFTGVVEELSHATSQLRVRGAFALMILWIVLSRALGVEVILGAFLAGGVISASSQRHESSLREKLDAIGFGFFIPIFFIMVGARFDLRALLDSPSALLLVPVLIAAAYMVKIVPALLFRTLFPWRETIAAGFLISSRLSLIIAASSIALDMGLISPSNNSAIILVAVVTCTFSPVLFSRILPTEQGKERKGVIIFGTDYLARLLAARLQKYGESITFVSRNNEQLETLRQGGFHVIAGSPLDNDVLEKAGASQARALIAIPAASDILVELCRRAREHFDIPTIVARVDDPAQIRELQALNVRVIQPATTTAMALEGALHFPASFDMLMDGRDDVDVMDVPLLNPSMAGKSLRRIRLPGNALVLGIRRQGELIVPHGDTLVQRADILMLVGSPDALREAQDLLGTADTPSEATRMRGRQRTGKP